MLRGRDAHHVEIKVNGDPDQLWERTQDPDQHERWDLRFRPDAGDIPADVKPRREESRE